MTEASRPVDCRPVYVQHIDPMQCRWRLRGVRIADLSRAALRRFARDHGVTVWGDTKLDLYAGIDAHLDQINWPADRDLKKLKAKQ